MNYNNTKFYKSKPRYKKAEISIDIKFEMIYNEFIKAEVSLEK